MAAEFFFYIVIFFAFAVGAVIGSFLNVVAHRVPTGQSIVLPRSRCPSCESPIRWYDNIPVISWFVLDAQCRDCKAPISSRYVWVEGLMGFLAMALWIKVASPHFQTIAATPSIGLPPPVPDVSALPWLSLGLTFALYLVFISLLVVISLVDIDHYLIPHEFTLPGIAIGVLAAVVLNSDAIMAPGSLVAFWPPVSLSSSLIGLVGGALAVVLLFYLYFALRGIAGLGGGDVTMMALVGAWLGWPALIFVFFAASIQGLLAAGAGVLLGIDFLKNSDEILAQDDPRNRAEEPPDQRDADLETAEPSAPGSQEDALDEPPSQADDNGESRFDDGHRAGPESDDIEAPNDANPDGEQDPKSETTESNHQAQPQASAETDARDPSSSSPASEDLPQSEIDEAPIVPDEPDDSEESPDDTPRSGGLAVPFGPFIAISALEYFFIGEFLPDWLSLSYLYYGL